MGSENNCFEQRLKQLIQRMESNYGMLIGEKSLCRLAFFLRGYMYEFYEENGYIFSFDKEFQAHIQHKLHSNETLHGDTALQAGRTDTEAFDEFYKQYHEWSRDG